MNMSRKKELADQYKQREIEGGVYAIRCEPSGKRMLDMTTDLAGARNRLQFSISTGLCPHHLLKEDWQAHGAEAFLFEVVEPLLKKEEESPKEYRESLSALLEMVRQGVAEEEQYR